MRSSDEHFPQREPSLLANGMVAWLQEGINYDPDTRVETWFDSVELMGLHQRAQLESAQRSGSSAPSRLADLTGSGDTFTWTSDGHPWSYETRP